MHAGMKGRWGHGGGGSRDVKKIELNQNIIIYLFYPLIYFDRRLQLIIIRQEHWAMRIPIEH